MALTQSARLAGPSWDEEVVPALRKRLEIESRTLARRMSAISLSSLDEQHNTNYSGYSDKTVRQKQPETASQQSSSSGAQRLQAAHQPAWHRNMATTVSPRINGTNHSSSKPTPKTEFKRARTYSSPYSSDLSKGKGRPKSSAVKPEEPTRSISSRTMDVKPTRIPKAASRPLPPHTNGYSHSALVTSSSKSPELPYQTSADQRGTHQGGAIPCSPTSSTVEISNADNRTSGILNETPPFPTEPTMSSGFSSQQGHDEDPPRPSMESEERPYEHWYRGEVSRNGGVGELRVGRRQEMLDIANYGHLIESKKKALKLKSRMPTAEDIPRQRKRAGSISGITDTERERGSLYLDEEHANEVGRVLDEDPLTDLDDGNGSDFHPTSSDYEEESHAYLPGIGEAYSTTEWTATAGAHEIRSTTPTSSNLFHRSSSHQQQNLPPTRIPGPSSRRSSESRSTSTTSPQPGAMARGAAEPMQTFSTASKTPSPPPPPSSSSSARQRYSSNSVPTAAQKRGASPASKKAKNAAKANRAKTLQRGSVAYYPTPVGDEEDMADAIPSWTQPVHGQGNWDEVVLPVVARKKGLDGHYEDVKGSPQPKKVYNSVEPAPGTFGFDKSKYRPPHTDMDSMPMDEFGLPEDKRQSMDQNEKLLSPMQEELPFRNPPSPLPSTAPFSHYAPTSVTVHVKQASNAQQLQPKPKPVEDDDKGAGCCQCVVM